MPTAIDEERFGSQETLDLSKPQGTAQGLPVKQIPHQEYPRCVYRHPVEPYREVLHRNVNHEVVERELVATEHLVHVCHDRREHVKKLDEGWVEKPYIPQAPPDPTEHLYARIANEVIKRAGDSQTPDSDFDLVAAQKFLISRGYKCDVPGDALEFVKAMSAKDRKGFLKQLAEYVPTEGEGQ